MWADRERAANKNRRTLAACKYRVLYATGNTKISLPNKTITWNPVASSACAGVLLLGRTGRPGVVLPGVGRDIGEDGHLVDVRVILGIYVLEFRMQGGVAGARQAGEALIDLHIRIADTEVGVIVIAGHPTRHLVGNLVGLGLEALALDETAERLGLAEVLAASR